VRRARRFPLLSVPEFGRNQKNNANLISSLLVIFRLTSIDLCSPRGAFLRAVAVALLASCRSRLSLRLWVALRAAPCLIWHQWHLAYRRLSDWTTATNEDLVRRRLATCHGPDLADHYPYSFREAYGQYESTIPSLFWFQALLTNSMDAFMHLLCLASMVLSFRSD